MSENPPFLLQGPPQPSRPVLISVPHAGRNYSAALIAAARVPLAVLRRLEDSRADLLAESAIAEGYSAVIASAPRALIDLNRAEEDCDPLAIAAAVPGLRPSRRARGGLGLIPTRLGTDGALWRVPISAAELEHRLANIHRPYHQAIAQQLTEMRRIWGAAVLIDLHSMPTPADPVDIVIGDRYGLTASSELVDHLLALAEGLGFSAARNHPYAGAFSIEHHAHRPSDSAAIQLEIARHLYLDDAGAIDQAGCARVQSLVVAMAEAAEASVAGPGTLLPIAAE
jgi:N-formylglutamate amidohydrolase